MAGSSSMPSLPPPCPKSPPDYPDLYGKRRGAAKVQMLEREIGFLELVKDVEWSWIWSWVKKFGFCFAEKSSENFSFDEELKSIEGLQHASRCCKEVVDFVVANSDPIIPTNSKSRKSCRFWKWLWYIFSFPFFKCQTAVTAIAIHVTAATAIAIHVTAATAIYVTAATAIYATAVHVSVIVVHLSAVLVSAVVHLSAVLVSAVVHLSAVLVSAVHVSAVHVSVVNASAVHVSALHVLAVYDPNGAVAVVHNQNVGVALGLVLTALTALKRCHAVDIVAFFNVLHAQIVLAAAGDAALVLNVQRSSVVNGYGTFLRA
ncbi:Guanine nucleotide-binding protein subunit gamma 3 [Vitis vinifera]|uniref:Guanine nucleotide-binding protein subunit gamma 3 n=1 Tax=Vitis vinifera TaxID=29760 RepID=A0A438J964_VITVI|nr:Guanine nucleotide-binding protein subunit gamma 3 [Vitis vinifera]